MDWFESLTGFREAGYEQTRRQFDLEGATLRSRVNGRECAIGHLECVSLGALRQRVAVKPRCGERSRVEVLRGDVRQLHSDPQFQGALFQAASQFNLLEMTGPDVTPEDGVTRYQFDPTQGPACAIAAGGATIYRNYFTPVGAGFGQTRDRQIDCLADVGDLLSNALNVARPALWAMKNGYALGSNEGVTAISAYLRSAPEGDIDELRAKLKIGIHSDVEVTDGQLLPGQRVSQAFCSALPIQYSDCRNADWAPFAQMVLDATYEATVLAGVLNARRGASNVVLLTQVGGGAFGNNDGWIDKAIRRALEIVKDQQLDIRIVSYGPPSTYLQRLARDFG